MRFHCNNCESKKLQAVMYKHIHLHNFLWHTGVQQLRQLRHFISYFGCCTTGHSMHLKTKHTRIHKIHKNCIKQNLQHYLYSIPLFINSSKLGIVLAKCLQQAVNFSVSTDFVSHKKASVMSSYIVKCWQADCMLGCVCLSDLLGPEKSLRALDTGAFRLNHLYHYHLWKIAWTYSTNDS